jgi:histone acetyltransferase 1
VRSPIDADVLEGDELVTSEPFSPAFTYPIFGEKEQIFGYRGLDIKVRSAARGCPVELTGSSVLHQVV